MANSKYDYVRSYESDDRLLPNAWIVVRVDGKGFHKFCDEHSFTKPNDKCGLDLMVSSAQRVLSSFNDLILAYGNSDEFSFVFKKDARIYSRRASKLTTNICSLFASSYVFDWPKFFPESRPLLRPPAFDGRAVLYPTNTDLRNYLNWRQVDCHINNLYNTTFWTLVQQGGMSNREAQERLSGTVSGDKNEILFSQFGINYNNEPEQFKKGTTIYKSPVTLPVDNPEQCHGATEKVRTQIVVEHCDIIKDDFWTRNPHLLDPFKDS